MLLEKSDIDAIIMEANHSFSSAVQAIVHKMSAAFVDNLAGMLRERGIDPRVGKTVFIGGGSILLKRYICSCQKVGKHIFIEDLKANVKGYELMYRSQQ
jgi:plasmid segregation protein ParM